MEYDLSRFTEAQHMDYARALSEIKAGRKRSHWIWYIFPQLKGLGESDKSWFYGIADLGEARAFLADPYLGGNLREICAALLSLDCSNPYVVMEYPDPLKLCSSMTLFKYADGTQNNIFDAVLQKFYGGREDGTTKHMLGLG